MSTKAEKLVIDAKVAKVREVVRNVSNNDIVLALHSFDFDVSKTIQALTTDIDSALGDWEKQGNAAKKSKQKKKNNKAIAADSSAATSTTTETPKVSSVSTRPAVAKNPPSTQQHSAPPPQPTKQPDPKVLSSSAKAFSQLADEEKRTELDSLLHKLDIKSAQIQKNIDDAYSKQSAVILSIQEALNRRERQLIAHLESTRQNVETQVQQQRATIHKLKQNPKNAADEFARANADQLLLDSLETNFTVHGDKVIKAIEKLGSSFLAASTEAVTYSAPVHQVNGNHQPKTVHQTPPQLNGQSIQQNGKPAHQPKQQNGKPSNKQVNGSDIKHSVSHSSLASEENDSGLGQVSPVSQEKNVARVADSGFLFASDGLDADQLAKLKAQVENTLKAQGIDPNILASISSSDSSSTVRPRNRPRKDNTTNANGKPTNKENKKPAGKAVKS